MRRFNASITAGGDMKSVSATHIGRISVFRYFSHFSLAVSRRSIIRSKFSGDMLHPCFVLWPSAAL